METKPNFHGAGYIGKELDAAFSRGVKIWLAADDVITDAWLLSFPKLNIPRLVCLEIKLDDGKDEFSLAYGQYLIFKNHFRDTLYIFQKRPDDMQICYWWLDPNLYLRVSGSKYKYLLLRRDKCQKGQMNCLKAIILNRMLASGANG